MTHSSRPLLPVFALTALIFSLLIAPHTDAAVLKKKTTTKVAAKSSRQEPKSRSAKSREKSAAKAKPSAKESRGRRNERASKSDRRSKRDERRASARRGDDDRKSGRKLSRRERLAESRREAERRRREEAARRAELARLAAIARAIAIARQRAADQALRDETAANVLRDDPTGEDLEVRRVAVEALGDHAGSVVVMDPKNGRVYSVVNQEWALRRGNVPCSTIKLVTGLAGLSETVIDPVQTVNISDGSYRLDLTDSLAYSNNAYFQKVGGHVGFERMMNYARQLGLGEKTGINHPNESPGRLPMFKFGYAVNHMSSHGSDIEVTTVQLANMASSIANGGTLLVPHLPRTPGENTQFKTEVRRRVNVPDEHLKRLLPGMIGAVTYGTGRLANDPTQTIAGKTGTCTGQGSKVGLFTSFAPVHDPRLAVAVILRGSGERGRTASAVAGKVYRGLNQRFGNRGGAPLIANDVLTPRPKIDPRRAAVISDEDAEADAETAAGMNGTVGTGNASEGAAAETNVKSTLKSVPATRPTDVTTRPTNAAPTSSTALSTAPTASPKQDDQRPRRVLTTTP
ncbi:MAG: penicillin-binding transpeptidase domain-containing protein [Acidobacteriota bacterium]|nr:penicillin-binding transpeptidase domain-containing protein [Acidobacteriota bacterium]